LGLIASIRFKTKIMNFFKFIKKPTLKISRHYPKNLTRLDKEGAGDQNG